MATGKITVVSTVLVPVRTGSPLQRHAEAGEDLVIGDELSVDTKGVVTVPAEMAERWERLGCVAKAGSREAKAAVAEADADADLIEG